MTSETTWDGLTARLADRLGRLSAGTVLQLHEVARPVGGPVAQLWQRPDRLVVAVSGDREGAPGRRLSARQRDSLRALGWRAPTPEHAGHWWTEFAGPVPAAGHLGLAAQLSDSLRNVLGLASPQELAYRAWHSVDGQRLTFDLGLVEIEIRHYARLVPGDPPERPSGLLRRIRIGAVDHDEALGRDGVWHPTETLELAALGELDDELVPLDSATADRVATWWRGLVDREGPQVTDQSGEGRPGPRLASAVDAERGVSGRPLVPGSQLSDRDRSRVAAYLRQAPMVAAAFGFDPDPFDPTHPEVVPLNVRTDGDWVWSESLAYFALRYGIAPEPDLMAHLARREYRLPEVDDEAIGRAADLLKGQAH